MTSRIAQIINSYPPLAFTSHPELIAELEEVIANERAACAQIAQQLASHPNPIWSRVAFLIANSITALDKEPAAPDPRDAEIAKPTMTEPEFAPELIERCRKEVLLRMNGPCDDLIVAVLRASGYAGLVEALEMAKPFVYAETKMCALYGKPYKDAADALARIDAALKAAGREGK